MTSVDALHETREIPPAVPAADGSRWKVWEQRLEALVDLANPIVVKETRQALKSRQFAVTFLIVLIGCWIASFGVIASIGPQIRYSAAGPDLFVWYYGILVAALAVVVPFSAFRSLAAEQEDNTYDLLSITTLSSRQIISGKLASAIIQIVIYLSAAAPFMAFTFLLRGIDFLTVALLLVLAVAGSIGLSALGLLAGTASRVRHTQVLLSVAFVLVLMFAFWGAANAAVEFLRESQYLLRDRNFWVALAMLATLYLTTFALVHAAVAAQIAFPSENRSTPLRVRMMIQQACFCGWLLYPYTVAPDVAAAAMGYLTVSGIFYAALYWFAMGALMTGEWPHLSRRVQRNLPEGLVARALFTWFYPGPGAGYMFAVANLTALVGLAAITLWFVDAAVATPLDAPSLAAFLILVWSYVVAYLGFGRLFINLLRRWAYVPMAAAFLLHAIVLLAGIGIPIIVDAFAPGGSFATGYTLKHLTNPFWTLLELSDAGLAAIEGWTPVVVAATLAIAALALNLRSVAAEMMRQRVVTPVRVLEEIALANPGTDKGPANPWETEEPPTPDPAT